MPIAASRCAPVRRQTMALQDIADRLIADLISQIGQRPHNPVIAPITVLLGHANDQLLDLSLDPRPAGAATCVPRTSSGVLKVRPGNIGDEGHQEQGEM